MTTIQDQKKQDSQNRFNQVAAAVTGAVVGAGVGIAGAVVLGDKKNREKISNVLNNVKDQAVDYVEGMQKQAEVKKVEIEKEFKKDKKIAQKVVSSAKNSLEHVVKDAKKVAHIK